MFILLVFFLSLTASIIGAISGIGGGIIIRPVLDLTGVYSVPVINFLSGCTILAMTISSLYQNHRKGIHAEKNTALFLAAGSICGGFTGKYILDILLNSVPNHQTGAVQSILIALSAAFVFWYQKKKNGMQTREVNHKLPCILIGFCLGCLSAFLGIGGGPINIMVLSFFFSMNSKKAAINSIYIIFFSQLSNLATTLTTHSVPDFTPSILVLMIVGSVTGGVLGSRVAERMSDRKVDAFFNVVLIWILAISTFNFIRYAGLLSI